MFSNLFIQCVQIASRSAKTAVNEPPIWPLMFNSPFNIGKNTL